MLSKRCRPDSLMRRANTKMGDPCNLWNADNIFDRRETERKLPSEVFDDAARLIISLVRTSCETGRAPRGHTLEKYMLYSQTILAG